MRARLVVASGLAAVLATGSTALAAAPWSPPREISAPVSQITGTAIDFGADGVALLSWTDQTDLPQAPFRAPVLHLAALFPDGHVEDRGRLEPGPTTFALGLLLFVSASAILVLLGRAGFGKDFGLTSRYITLTMFGFIGLHRAVLALQEPSRRGLLMGILLAATVASVFSSFTSGLSSGFGSRSHHRRNRDLAMPFVRAPDDGGIRNTRVREEQRFELRGRHPVGADLDEVLQAVHDEHVPIMVHATEVTGL